MALLKLKHVQKIYNENSNNPVKALKDVSLEVNQGEFVAIMGESGAGKSTLLNIIAALEQPTNGEIILNDQNFNQIKEKDRAKFRRLHLGFVFQSFNLLNSFSNQDNIFLPLVLSRYKYQEMQQRIKTIANQLGIEKILNRFPYEISGGQQQRVSIARALITKPELILADEPTGALDSVTSRELLDIFDQINNQQQTIIMVTHSAMAASYAQRTLFIKDGIVFNELFRGDQTRKEYAKRISLTLDALISRGDE